ncbi:hypothetical protein BKA67DRAFT_692587, partial [Truncatella angustata]
ENTSADDTTSVTFDRVSSSTGIHANDTFSTSNSTDRQTNKRPIASESSLGWTRPLRAKEEHIQRRTGQQLDGQHSSAPSLTLSKVGNEEGPLDINGTPPTFPRWLRSFLLLSTNSADLTCISVLSSISPLHQATAAATTTTTTTTTITWIRVCLILSIGLTSAQPRKRL